MKEIKGLLWYILGTMKLMFAMFLMLQYQFVIMAIGLMFVGGIDMIQGAILSFRGDRK